MGESMIAALVLRRLVWAEDGAEEQELVIL